MKTKGYSFGMSIALVVLTYGLLSSAQVLAADLSPPQLAIEEASSQMKARLQSDDFTEDFIQVTRFVEEVIYPHVDFNRISALVLGKHWKKANKEQRQKFKAEFQTLLVRTYARAFVNFKEWSVRFLPLKMKADSKKVVVKTEVLQPGVRPLAINYRMVLVKGNWKVYDIIIEGVSLVTNYRTSFKNEVKRSGSLDAVIIKMSERNQEALQPKGKNS